MDRLLVDGFVREVEKTILKNMIIPIDIFHICFDFYFSSKFIFYLASLNRLKQEDSSTFGSFDYEIDNSMLVANIETKKQWNCNVYKLSDHNTNILNSIKHHKEWTVDCGGIAFTRNLKLANPIQTQLHYPKNKFNNIVFTLGGITRVQDGTSPSDGSTDCNALIANSRQFSENKTEIINVYKWDLPKFPVSICYNYILYSYTQKALFNIGGADTRGGTTDYNTIHKLTFDYNNEIYMNGNTNKWKWNELEVKLAERKGNVCATMIDNGNKLMIAGGCSGHIHLDTVEILDFNCNKMIKVKELNAVRMDAGIYYDMVSDVVYVGGGYANSSVAKQSVEWYDFKKNIWYSLPKTFFQHDMNPMIWVENNNLLHIMSVQANGCEFIDLREAKQWEKSIDDLETLFKTKFDIGAITSSRIVGN